MARILDLPNEVLGMIVALTMPEGIESVCQSCKRLYEAGAKYLPEHRELTKRYRSFAYAQLEQEPDFGTDGNEYAPISTPLGLLVRAAANPLILSYIQHADMRGSRLLTDDGSPTGKRLRGDPAARHALVNFLLRTSPLLADARFEAEAALDAYLGIDPEPPYMAQMKSKFALDLALIMLMTNVRVLALPRDWEDFAYMNEGDKPAYSSEQEGAHGVWRVLDLMVLRARERPQVARRGAALTQLKTLLPMVGTGEEHCVFMAVNEAFVALPTLREFYGGSICTLEDGILLCKFLPRYSGGPSALETIWLNGTVMAGKDMAAFLKDHKALRHLRYRHECKIERYGFQWDTGHFLQGIMGTVGASLEELSIGQEGLLYSGSGATSLRGFERLRNLELCLEVFEGPRCGEQLEREFYKDLEGWGEVVEGPNETPPLVDMLPSTLETCLLCCTNPAHLEVLVRLFADFDEAHWRKSLPKLRCLKISVDEAVRKAKKERENQNDYGTDASSAFLLDLEDPKWDPMKRALSLFKGALVEEYVCVPQSFELPPRLTNGLTDWWADYPLRY